MTDSGKENAVLLRQLLGPPKISALEEGLAIHFTGQWQERGYAYWAARLYQSGNLAPLKELLDNESFQRESSLVMGCLSASFVDCLIDHWGKEAFLEHYASWQPGAKEIRELEARWHQHLSQTQTQPQPQSQPQSQPQPQPQSQSQPVPKPVPLFNPPFSLPPYPRTAAYPLLRA